MANEVQLDALPYVDQGYEEPGVREGVSGKLCVLPSVWLVLAGDCIVRSIHFFWRLALQAMRLVEEETRRYRPTKNYLEFLQPPKLTFEVSSTSSSAPHKPPLAPQLGAGSLTLSSS